MRLLKDCQTRFSRLKEVTLMTEILHTMNQSKAKKSSDI